MAARQLCVCVCWALCRLPKVASFFLLTYILLQQYSVEFICLMCAVSLNTQTHTRHTLSQNKSCLIRLWGSQILLVQQLNRQWLEQVLLIAVALIVSMNCIGFKGPVHTKMHVITPMLFQTCLTYFLLRKKYLFIYIYIMSRLTEPKKA